MRKLALAIGMVFAAEAAIACVCVGPLTPEQQRETARRIAAEASAVAVVEQAQPMDYDAMRPELYRVLKLHVGAAPATFRLARHMERTATGETVMVATSCDVVPPPGEPTLVVLYPSPTAGTYSIGGTCDHMFVNSPGAIDLIRDEAGKLERSGERG